MTGKPLRTIAIPIGTESLEHTILTRIVPTLSTKLSILGIILPQWTIGGFDRGHPHGGSIGRHLLCQLVLRLGNGINLTGRIFRIHLNEARLPIGTFLGGTAPAPSLGRTTRRGLLERSAAKVITLHAPRIGQFHLLHHVLVHVIQRMRQRVRQDEVTARHINVTPLSPRTFHIGTMSPYRLRAPRLARAFGLRIILPAKHFIGGIAILGIQRKRVGGHLNVGNETSIAGCVGEARVAGDEALVVRGGGAPLTIGAGVGLEVGEG
jgi:hypothetical protein